MTKRTCSADGCGKDHKGRGYCRSHLLRFKKYGDPLTNFDPTVDPNETFAKHCGEPTETGCIEWQAALTNRGYGKFKSNQKTISAHRFSYEKHKGPIPEGFVVRHACDNPPCVNPDHLLVGTHRDNKMDAIVRNRVALGEEHGNSKLTEIEVAEIWQLLPHHTYADIARRYGVAYQTIGSIDKGETWAWLTGARR